jgi:hypothetical protein
VSADVEAIHEGLANAAGTLAGLHAYPSLPGAIEPPVFAPVEFEMDYHQTFGASGGLTQLDFSCGLFSSLGDNDAGRKILLQYLAPNGALSILGALESDKTLGGACSALIVKKVRGAYRLYEIGATMYLGAMIDVKVWA